MQRFLQKMFFSGMLIVAFAIFGHGLVSAQGAAQAFAILGKGGVTGLKAIIWTAQQANMNKNWVASPVGICTQTPVCLPGDGYVETGYIKEHGIVKDAPDNVLQQYTTYADGKGNQDHRYELGNLMDDSLYTFTVISQPANGRWDIKRGGTVKWSWSYAETGFSAGRRVSCGAEAWLAGTTMAVQCSEMRYYYLGAWSRFNYNDISVTDGYCVNKPFEFGALGWGPC